MSVEEIVSKGRQTIDSAILSSHCVRRINERNIAMCIRRFCSLIRGDISTVVCESDNVTQIIR